MKRYQYQEFHERPLIQPATPQDFKDWVFKVLNEYGGKGWRIHSYTLPQISNQFTGDLLILGEKELPALAAVAAPEN